MVSNAPTGQAAFGLKGCVDVEQDVRQHLEYGSLR
jgi:hypothetical protein